MSFNHFMNGGDQFLAGRLFEQIAGSARPKSFGGERDIGMHSQEDNLRRQTFSLDLPNSIKAIQEWHRDIGDDDIRLELFGGFYQRSTVGDNPDQIEFTLQNTL